MSVGREPLNGMGDLPHMAEGIGMQENHKFGFQESEYRFPYHYLPSLNDRGVLRLQKQLTWGLDYMTYMTYVCDLVRQRRPESLLDVGCGDGRLIHMLKHDVPWVTGVDLSPRAIAFARAFNPDVEFICGGISSLSAQYAVVTLIEVLEHIPDSEMGAFLRCIAGLVQDDGRLLISVPTVNVPLTKKHYRHYDLDFLDATIAPYFEIEEHVCLFRRGFLERCLRWWLCNSTYVLNSSFLLALTWRLHRRLTYKADATSGAHLVCVAKRRKE